MECKFCNTQFEFIQIQAKNVITLKEVVGNKTLTFFTHLTLNKRFEDIENSIVWPVDYSAVTLANCRQQLSRLCGHRGQWTRHMKSTLMRRSASTLHARTAEALFAAGALTAVLVISTTAGNDDDNKSVAFT